MKVELSRLISTDNYFTVYLGTRYISRAIRRIMRYELYNHSIYYCVDAITMKSASKENRLDILSKIYSEEPYCEFMGITLILGGYYSLAEHWFILNNDSVSIDEMDLLIKGGRIDFIKNYSQLFDEINLFENIVKNNHSELFEWFVLGTGADIANYWIDSKFGTSYIWTDEGVNTIFNLISLMDAKYLSERNTFYIVKSLDFRKMTHFRLFLKLIKDQGKDIKDMLEKHDEILCNKIKLIREYFPSLM